MPYIISRTLLLAILSLAITACGGNYNIAEPAADSVHADPPESFVIGFREEPEELPAIMLNGNPVAEFFSKGADSATASGADLNDFLVEGENRFHVDPPLGPRISFIYDTQGPEVVILEAENNLVTGMAIDDVGIEHLYVNNLPIELDENGHFSVNVLPADMYRFAGQDELGHSSEIYFRSTSLQVDNAIRARVNQSGLNFVAAELKTFIQGMDFNPHIAGTKVYSDVRTGPLGTKRGREGEITNLSFNLKSLSLDPTNEGLRLRGEITDLYVRFRLVSYLGILPDIVIKPQAYAFSADIDGLVELGKDDSGKPTVNIKSIDLDLGLLRFLGALGVFDNIINNLISNTINLLDQRIGNALKSPLNNAVSNAIDDFVPDSYAFNVNNAELEANFRLGDLGTNNNAITLGVIGGLTAPTPNPLIPNQLGARFVEDPINGALPGGGDLGVAINSNMINHALAAAFQSGITHLSIINSNVSVNLPRDDNAGEDGTNRILIDPMTAPYVEVSKQDGSPNIRLVVHGLQVQSQTRNGDSWKNDFLVNLSASVELGVTVGNNNTLDIAIDANPLINFHSIQLGETAGINEEFAEGVVADIVPQVLNRFSDALTGIKIPALQGYLFTVDSINTLGDKDNFVGFTGSMSKQ